MIIKIQGGLGNQMFQYAYGRKLELSGKKIIFDVSFFTKNKYKNDTPRNFKLNNFNIETKAKFLYKRHFILDIFNKILTCLRLKQNYYQNENFFSNIKDNIKKEFTLKNPLKENSRKWKDRIDNSPNSVSVHIRRGDYVNNNKVNDYHGTCSLSYYENAIKILEKNISQKFNIFVFSDDIEWAKTNLKLPHQIDFVSNPEIPDCEEMYLMSLCKNNIIANSTFSWWGAWLNKNPKKIIVGPRQWFAKKTSERLDILPKDWIKI